MAAKPSLQIAKVDPEFGTHLDIQALPEEERKVLVDFDVDGSGTIQVGELALAAQAYKAQKDQNRLLNVALIFMGVFFLLLVGTMTGLIYAIVEANKDTKNSSGGTMVSKDSNTPVLTSSSSYVTIDGQPVLRSYIATLISNDLANGGGPTTVRRLAARRLAQATGTPAPGTPAPGNPAPGSQGGSTSVTPGSTPHLFNATPPPGTSPTNAYYYTGNPADAPMEQPSTDPTQSYDSYNNYTSNDMTPAMMQHAVNYGPAPECSMAMRVFTPMDSLMDPKSLDYLRRVVIHQGPLSYSFDVAAAGSMPRCALNATSDPTLHPCVNQDVTTMDMLAMIELDGIGPILLDRTEIRFPMTMGQAMAELQRRGFSIPASTGTMDGAFLEGHFNNSPELAMYRCPDGSFPRPGDGVCEQVHQEAQQQAQQSYPKPDVVNGTADIQVSLPGSVGLNNGLNHNGVLETFESVAVVPGPDGQAYACNPDHTSAPGTPSGEIWHLNNIYSPSFDYNHSETSANGTTTAGTSGNMQVSTLKLGGQYWTPIQPQLCRFAGFDANNPHPTLPQTMVIFVARQTPSSSWKVFGIDLNADLAVKDNVVVLGDLTFANVSSSVVPADMYFDNKYRAIYLTVDNMLVQIDVKAAPTAPTAIVNTANITADFRANSSVLDGPLATAKLLHPRGIGGRLHFGQQAGDPCGADFGCLLVADYANNRLRLVDMAPGGQVYTAVGDGNVLCRPPAGTTSTTDPTQPLPPCSVDGYVPLAIPGFVESGGWATCPGNQSKLSSSFPMADVDFPMQVVVDVMDGYNATNRPPFFIWMTEQTDAGTVVRVINQDGQLRTLGNPSDINPQRPRTLRSFSLTDGLLVGVLADGTLIRGNVVYSANQDPAQYQGGYDSSQPYATSSPQRRLAMA